MKLKNIDQELEELTKRFNTLEVKYTQLHNQSIQEDWIQRDQISELERKNKEQVAELKILKESINSTTYNTENTLGTAEPLTKSSFKKGSFIQVTTNYQGKKGLIGKVYHTSERRVHFRDIKTGYDSSRAFHNIITLDLPDTRKDHLSK